MCPFEAVAMSHVHRKWNCERRDVTSVSRALARALVIGPSGVVGDVDASMGMIVGCSASPSFSVLGPNIIVGHETGLK